MNTLKIITWVMSALVFTWKVQSPQNLEQIGARGASPIPTVKPGVT